MLTEHTPRRILIAEKLFPAELVVIINKVNTKSENRMNKFISTAIISGVCLFRRSFIFYVFILILIISSGFISAGAEQFKWIIEPRFENAECFSEGLAAVKSGGLYGYINRTGTLVVDPSFSEAGDFHDGIAAVRKNGMNTLINFKGIPVIAAREDESRFFGEGLAVVKINGKYGYMTGTGKIFLKPVYEYALPFNEGKAAVKLNGRFGFIDRRGKIIIRPVYEKASAFSEGLAAVKITGKWGYINKGGRTVLKAVYAEAGDFREGCAAVKTEPGSGYIDTGGKFIISPQFEAARPFSENIAAVMVRGKWGYIKRMAGTGETGISKKSAKVTLHSPDYVKEPVQYSGNEKSEKAITVKKKDEVIKTPEVVRYSEKNEDKDSTYSGGSEKNMITEKSIPVIRGMEFVGILSEMTDGQVIVTDYRTGDKVYLGAWCITEVEDDRVYIEAGTPFSTVAKCDFRNGFYEKIKPGMKVYKKNK